MTIETRVKEIIGHLSFTNAVLANQCDEAKVVSEALFAIYEKLEPNYDGLPAEIKEQPQFANWYKSKHPDK